jgi:hypothetical protein
MRSRRFLKHGPGSRSGGTDEPMAKGVLPMERRPTWLSQEADLEKPSAARCYDYYLGGAHNFEVDRELAREILAIVPNAREVAQHNRAFLRRTVRFCIDQGIRQFLDVGSGIPSVGNVHEIAQEIDPEVRVVYVDNEPVAVAHSRTILEGNEHTAVVNADLVAVDDVLDHPETRRLLDLSEPVGLLMVAVLHFVPDSDKPPEVVRGYYERLAAGSHLAVSHFTDDYCRAGAKRVVDLCETSLSPVTFRTRDEVAELFSDFELLDPGVVYVPDWRPDTEEDVLKEPDWSIIYGAVGRKV